ncbi:MAG: hypothetical protein WCG44_04320 [bacterium]
MKTKNVILKIGAYTGFTIGIILSIACALTAIFLLVAYPDALISRKILVTLLFLIIAIVIFVISYSFFENTLETVKHEHRFEHLEEDHRDE